MSPARHAIHSIRNDLTPILCFAEMAKAGNREAQKLLVEELLSRAGSIRDELDVLTKVVRRVQVEAIAV